MRILGVNGINNTGKDTTDPMLRALADLGWLVKDVNYPKANFISAHFKQERNAKKILAAHLPGDCVIAHSYGCLLTFRAMQMGAEFGTVIFFAPAMSQGVTFPYNGCKRLVVIYHTGDVAIRIGAKLWFHDFGKMGMKGYRGPKDSRVSSVRTKGDGSLDKYKHSDYFTPAKLASWVKFVNEVLSEDYGRSE